MELQVYLNEDSDLNTECLDFKGKWEDVKKQIEELKEYGLPDNWEELPIYEWLTIDEVEYEDETEESVWEVLLDDIYYNSDNEKTLKELFDDYTDWYIMDDEDKEKIAAYMKYGYSYDWCIEYLNDLEIYVFPGCADEKETLEKFARFKVEEGLYGNIPETLTYYIDYNLLGRDLGVEYAVIEPGVVINPL